MVEKKSKKSAQSGSKAELEKQIKELTKDLQRVQAEFENYRRRAEEEQHRAVNIGKESVVTVLIPVIDNVERALSATPADLKDHEYVAGIQAIAKQLTAQLENLGVRKIESEGQEFDPELMEAVAVDGKGKKEIVSEELQAGYTMGDMVIRHAMVKVRKK